MKIKRGLLIDITKMTITMSITSRSLITMNCGLPMCGMNIKVWNTIITK